MSPLILRSSLKALFRKRSFYLFPATCCYCLSFCATAATAGNKILLTSAASMGMMSTTSFSSPSSSPPPQPPPMFGLTEVLGTFREKDPNGLPTVMTARGSVLDFTLEKTTTDDNNNNHQHNADGGSSNSGSSSSSNGAGVGAIVNAANVVCLGGGGVDGAITNAGGPTLAAARQALPVLDGISYEDDEHMSCTMDIRCRTGSAVLTGPDQFGSIAVPYVIHAVGPNFWDVESEEAGLKLLQSAYQTTLDVAAETNDITHVAFCLLSAGVFRAQVPLKTILKTGVQAIADWRPKNGTITTSTSEGVENVVTKSKIQNVIICAFTQGECEALDQVSREVFSPSTTTTNEEGPN